MKLLQRAGIPWCLLLFFYAFSAAAVTEFHFTPNCLEAQKQIKVMKLDQARRLLQAERRASPDNPAIDYLEDYIDYFTLVTGQSVDDLRRLEKNKDARIERIRNSSPASPWYQYAQAEINLHWAFARIVNQEYVTAAFEFRTAYVLLENNSKKFPSFKTNQKSLGMLRAVLGTAPDNLKWLLNIIGMKGDLQKGMKEIREYLDQKEFGPEQLLEKQSAEFYYTLLLLNFGDKQECWKFCTNATSDYESNLLSTYLRAFTAIKTGHGDEAIEACAHRPHTNEFAPLIMLDFLMGKAKLNRMDKDADIYLKKYVTFYKGRNLVKDAYKRLSWFHLLQGDTLKFNTYRGLARKYGAANSDEDKNAQKEAEEGILPDAVLLKGRLLFDGGYYQRAEDVIRSHSLTFRNRYQKIEYYYRYGRIMQGNNKPGKAIEMYNLAIKQSDGTNFYFAPASCLQLGYIYEKLGQREQARSYFRQSLTYHNYEYHSGVSQEAKVALTRLN